MENQVNKQQNNNIVKKPKKKKFWIVILIVVIGIIVCIPILFVVFIALIIWIDSSIQSDATDGKFSQCVDASICTSDNAVKDYYDTVEDARDARNKEDNQNSKENKFDLTANLRPEYIGETSFDDEILRIEDEDAITLISVYKNEEIKKIKVYTFQKKDGKYSNCVAFQLYEVKNMITSSFMTGKGIYEFEEEIAQDLSTSCLYNQTSFANDGVMMPYGLTDDEFIYDVTIMGEEPTDIIPIDYDGTTYYFWYFDSEAIDEKIREEIQGEMTLGKVVDGLQIEVDYN